jgi:hypothetical protein
MITLSRSDKRKSLVARAGFIPFVGLIVESGKLEIAGEKKPAFTGFMNSKYR